MKALTFILIVAISILLGSCKKDKDEIDGGFECKLNGVKWLPLNSDWKSRAVEAHLTLDDTQIFILATNDKSHENIAFSVHTKDAVINTGKYKLDMPHTQFGFYSKNDFHGDYLTKTGYEGEVEIVSLDKSAKRITGRFHFRCFNETTSDAAEITDGEFNLKYVEY